MAAHVRTSVCFRKALNHYFQIRKTLTCARINISERTFLSEAYSCNEKWSQRLQESTIKQINMNEYFIELDRKFNSSKKVSAIDIDLFVNKVTKKEEIDDLEELIYRFRRTPSTIHTLESTHHAVVRACLELGAVDALMRILNDRVNYGIFPDYYACNMIMHTLLKQKNYQEAAKVAVYLMLQEDFDHPIVRQLALYSCHMHLQFPSSKPWDQFEEKKPKEDDDEEEVWVRVSFIPQPYFDDHFDLRDSKKLIGKTLALLGKEHDDIVGHTYQLIGWMMFEKWDKAKLLMESLLQNRKSILKEGIIKIQQLMKEIPEEETKVVKEIDLHLQKFIESGLVSDEDLHQLITEKVKTAVASQEAVDIQQLLQFYSNWEDIRKAELDKQIALYFQQQRLKKIQEVKEQLAEEEERLFFFENLEQHRINIPPEEEDQLITEEGKLSAKSLFDVPPEIEGKDGRFSKPIIEENEPWWRWKNKKSDEKD